MTSAQILYKRKKGYSPLEIYKYHQSCVPLLDELIILKHISRVCNESGLPFSKTQIKRVFNKIHKKDFHGQKTSYWNFVSKECGNKVLVFKKDQSPIKKCPLDPLFQKNKAHDEAFTVKTDKCTTNPPTHIKQALEVQGNASREGVSE